MKYTQKQIKTLLDGIYDGSVTEYDLPQDLYLAIADYLKKGLYEGFGNTLSKLSENLADGKESLNDLELLAELRSNIYMFSAAKTFQQVKDMTSALVNEDGVPRSFSAFKKEALDIFGLYNETWLKTEYNTAIGQAQEAIKWQRIEEQKDVLPYLKYSAVLDPNTSIICRPLDGIVAPVGDPIWSKIAPLNHFNCRCLLLQVDSEEGLKGLTPQGDKLKRVEAVEAEMQPVFKMNAGKDGYIFKGDHPYFEVAKRDREFAKNNFDLPIPKMDNKGEILTPEFVPAKNIKEAAEYAKNVLGTKYADFKGVNIEVANDMNKGLFNTKVLMPEIQINGIGSAQECNKVIKSEALETYRKSNYYKSTKEKFGLETAERVAEKVAGRFVDRVQNGVLAFSRTVENYTFDGVEFDLNKFKGIFINAKEAKSKIALDEIVKHNSKVGWFTKDASEFKYIMDHELGHEVDKFLGFRKDPRFIAIYEREHKAGIDSVTERLSKYGATAGNRPKNRPAEMIAEAWAEFVSSPNPRELSKEIGELMRKKYYETYKTNAGLAFEPWKSESLKLLKK